MCGHKRELQAAGADLPADGATVRLNDLSPTRRASCRAGFPWWSLWMLWPLFWLIKGAAALSAPVLAWLSQPVLLAVTPLPLLLIGAGVAVLVIGALRRRG
jgi:hypothetical protein